MTTEKMNKSAIYSWLIIALLGIYINLEQSFLTILSEWWFWLSLCGILLFCMVLIYKHKLYKSSNHLCHFRIKLSTSHDLVRGEASTTKNVKRWK